MCRWLPRLPIRQYLLDSAFGTYSIPRLDRPKSCDVLKDWNLFSLAQRNCSDSHMEDSGHVQMCSDEFKPAQVKHPSNLARSFPALVEESHFVGSPCFAQVCREVEVTGRK